MLKYPFKKEAPVNVFGEPLEPCSHDPSTGYFRDGHCNTCEEDTGSHTVCIVASKEFLQFSRFKGNNLTTPVTKYGFPGVKPGDCWCLCATRWLEAFEAGMAPRVFLTKTHKRALDLIPLERLKEFAVDLE